MALWNRTNKPLNGNATIQSAADIIAVDATNVTIPGMVGVGWVHRKFLGSRVFYELLVAMNEPPPADAITSTSSHYFGSHFFGRRFFGRRFF